MRNQLERASSSIDNEVMVAETDDESGTDTVESTVLLDFFVDDGPCSKSFPVGLNLRSTNLF